MALDWISVMVVKPMSLMPINVDSQTFPSKAVNFWSDNMPRHKLEPGTERRIDVQGKYFYSSKGVYFVSNQKIKSICS